MKHRFIYAFVIAVSAAASVQVQAASVAASISAALKGQVPTQAGHGQPNQSCQLIPNTPGRAVSAPGSAFNPAGKAGTVYAGTQPQNSKNPVSVAQYDVACSEQPVF